MTERVSSLSTIPRRVALLAILLLAIAAVTTLRPLIDGNARFVPATSVARHTAAEQVAALEQRVRDQPNDVEGLTQLAGAYLQRARESGDPSFYTLAGNATSRALALDPNDVQATIVAGSLALSRHDFHGALLLGVRARQLAPDVTASYGVITDALVETGRYDEGSAAAQELADRHPDFAAYSRVSYIRELRGDVGGAITAMQQAIGAGTGLPQDEVWARELIAGLELTLGDVPAAEDQYRRAADLLPDDPAAHEGLARLALLQGDYAAAAQHLQRAIDQRPLLQYVVELGDLLSADGRTADAQKQYALVGAIKQLYAANGIDGDMELSLFNADHGIDPEKTYETALAAYARRSSIYGADAVAWTALKAGHLGAAETYMALATRLGTRDPRLTYHAGMIALAAGDIARSRHGLEDGLSRAPLLSPLDAASARSALDAIGR